MRTSSSRQPDPVAAMYTVIPKAGHWKYTLGLLRHLKTPTLLVSSRHEAFQQHICEPILKWSPGPHTNIFARAGVLLQHIRNISRLLRISRKYRVRILHFQTFEPISIGFFLPRIRRKFLPVISVHNVYPHEYYSRWSRALEIWLRKIIYQQAKALFIFSAAGASLLEDDFNVDREKIHYLPMAVHEDIPDPLPDRSKVSKSPIFLMFGAYRSNKGFEVLSRAFLGAKMSGLPGSLRIAGEYPLEVEHQVRQDFAEHNCENFLHFENQFIPEDDIDNLMRSVDVMLLPYTNFSSQSGILFLAYAYHLPVIASRVGGLTEAVKEDGTGLLVTPGDVEALQDALFEVLDRYQDFIEVRPSKLLLKKYSWKTIGHRTDQVYQQVLEENDLKREKANNQEGFEREMIRKPK